MLKNKGITLVALVITIIVLLILSGITIATLTGENGLFKRAKEAKEKSSYSQAEEKVKLAVNASYDNNANLSKDMLKENLNKIEGINPKVENVEFNLKVTVDGYEFIITGLGEVITVGKQEELPENTPSTGAGTEVKPKDEWTNQTVKYIKTNDGTEEKREIVSTVYGVSDGIGNTVPVPYGFFYVGGDFNTGVIISDNEEDKYDGKTNKTSWEYAGKLKGNQFVWIPCDAKVYHKTEWGTEYQNANWASTTEKGELIQIEKYGGFYVGRYEAGLATTIPEFTTTQKHTGSNQIYNKNGIPQSKAGQIPWMFIDWVHAKENAESMYSTNSVSSGLITGTQWDMMLNKIIEKTDLEEKDLKNSEKWGNYKNTSINYRGRLAKGYYSSGWYLPEFEVEKEGKTSIYNSGNTYGDVLSTGASSVNEKYHLYDIAGNLFEWTEETSMYGIEGQYRIVRGGRGFDNASQYGACYRGGGSTVNTTNIKVGFRTVLYIK